MADARAILAGSGALPGLVAAAGPTEVVTFAGVPAALTPTLPARFERLGEMFAGLKARGVTELCLAGAMGRPALDPAVFDAETTALVPRIAAALGQGDDALLTTMIAILEEAGFQVRAAHELRPDLLAAEGVLAGALAEALRKDAARANAVLAALGPLDVGQGAVAAKGQVLGIETLQGTDAMLDFVARSRPGSGGVFVKRPKPGQDLRADMPVIGPDTVRHAAAAGLKGIALAAGGVMLLTPEAVIAEAEAAGLALWAEP